MYKRINVYDFCDLMKDDALSNYTHDALLAIFDHVEQMENEFGEPIAFSRGYIRERYHQYETIEDAENDNFDFSGYDGATSIKLPAGGYVIFCDS